LSDDRELEMLKRRRLLEMQRRLMGRKDVEPPEPKVRPREVLDKIFYGRAWEVWRAAETQFPAAMKKLESVLADLVSSKKIRKRVSGEELLWFLRRIGLNVQMKTKIRIYESGELKTIAQKLKE